MQLVAPFADGWRLLPGLAQQRLKPIDQGMVDRVGKLPEPVADICQVQLMLFEQDPRGVFVVARSSGEHLVDDQIFGRGVR